jgi:catalase
MLVMAITAVASAPEAAKAQNFDPQPIVDLMRAGAGPGTHRPSGAKGQCYMARFEPTAEARALSKASIFAAPTAAIVRLSVGGGNPRVADAARGPNRGLSFRIDPNGPGQTELVMVNAPINFARTPKQMLEFIQVRRPVANGQPDADKLKAFNDANPETLAQARYLAGRPIPASWVGVTYHAIHAYTLSNAAGATQLIKFRMVPLGGETGLTDEEARAKPADYLADELADRLRTGRPAGFEMRAVMGRPGDHTADVTRQWEGEDARPTVTLGTLRITAVEANATCDTTFFAPTILAEGIAGPKEDPMFEIRTPAYAISITKRAN